MKPFRLLRADEIDVRLQQFKTKDKQGRDLPHTFAQYLLYKDARCDMNLMTEVYGDLWKREHEFKDGRLYCKVSVWNKEIGQWISREDVGTESNTEAEKGQASDSFKRACVNFGVGRELYSAPSIVIWLEQNPNLKENTKLHVNTIEYDDNENISFLELFTDKGVLVYTYGKKTQKNGKKVANTEQSEPVVEYATTEQYKLIATFNQNVITNSLKKLGKESITDMTKAEAEKLIEFYQNKYGGQNGK